MRPKNNLFIVIEKSILNIMILALLIYDVGNGAKDKTSHTEKLVVASKNPMKIAAVRNGFEKIFPDRPYALLYRCRDPRADSVCQQRTLLTTKDG